MNIVCLDMEGVLVPEIWIAFAEESGIPELRRTTRASRFTYARAPLLPKLRGHCAEFLDHG